MYCLREKYKNCYAELVIGMQDSDGELKKSGDDAIGFREQVRELLVYPAGVFEQ